MKILILLSLSLAVVLGMPLFVPDVEKNPVLTEDQKALVGDVIPEQGHVVVEDPLPQVKLDVKEQQEKLPLVPVDVSVVQQEVKVKPEVEQEDGVKTEVKAEPEAKVVQEAEAEPEVKVEKEAEAEPEVKVVQEAEEEPEVKVEKEAEEEQEVKADPEFQIDLEANVEPEVNVNPVVMAELEDDVKPVFEMEPELQEVPDFKVESEVQVKPELEPMFKKEQEVQEKFQVQMSLEEETETGGESEEKHIDMENKYDMSQTLMELELLDDDSMFEEEVSDSEQSEMEKSLKAAFQNQDQPLPAEEPIMELETVTEEESFAQQPVLPDAAFMEDGPALDIMGQPIAPMDEYFLNVEARLAMEPEEHSEPGEYLMMEEPVNEYVNEEESYAVMRDSPGGVEGRSFGQNEQGWGCSSGMALEGKCYQFFKEPKAAADAELFCQEQFAGGHLASITSQYVHRELVNMIHQQNGPYRAWVGGLRFLKTGRFIWLDGSQWGYTDWLSGEPSSVEDVECVEVLANREGKFNDFTCGEPLAFICSFPY